MEHETNDFILIPAKGGGALVRRSEIRRNPVVAIVNHLLDLRDHAPADHEIYHGKAQQRGQHPKERA